MNIKFNTLKNIKNLKYFTLFSSFFVSLFISSLFLIPASASANVINILSPTVNSYQDATFTLKAQLSGYSTDNYNLFWYVDNGTWNYMPTSADKTAKQVDINVSNWKWHQPSDNYTIDLVAVINGSGQRIYTQLPIIVSQQPSSPTTEALYVNPDSNASQTAATTTDPTMKRVMTKMAAQPTATWFGDWNSNITADVNSIVTAASQVNQLPVLVSYNIPQRDCGSYSSGGATSAAAYQSWINGFSAGLAGRPAIIIVEPDALAQISCLNTTDQASRYQLLNYAVNTFKEDPQAKVYLDAGNPDWISATDMASRLNQAGINQADGFSLNVSNFYTTSQNVDYGNQISALDQNKHYVIDTGRNGNGSDGQWCNPPNMALGNTPTSQTGQKLVDYYLWIKVPGESDGSCNGGPTAGSWWPAYGESLALNAGW